MNFWHECIPILRYRNRYAKLRWLIATLDLLGESAANGGGVNRCPGEITSMAHLW